MPSTIGNCKLFRIKHIALLEGETFLRNKHEIAFFEIKCTFFGRKENTISIRLFSKPISCTGLRRDLIYNVNKKATTTHHYDENSLMRISRLNLNGRP